MSDLEATNSAENRLCREHCLKSSAPSNVAEAEKSTVSLKYGYYNVKKPSCNEEDESPVSPGTEVHAFVMPEETSFCNFNIGSADKNSVPNQGDCFPVPGNQSNKYSSSDEMDKVLFSVATTNSKSTVMANPNSKANVDKSNISSTGKIKHNTNFSIFGQLLNKKQSNVAESKGSHSYSNYSLPENSRQSHLIHDSKKEGPDSSGNVQRAQMKTKLRSMWNSVKYGWRMKRDVNLKTDSAIWLLGQCYHNKLNDDVDFSQDISEQLRLDLLSKIWLTYRMNFPVIPGTNLVSDSGWGCMLRCGQMMMAQAFVCHFLKRDWRYSPFQPEDKTQLYKTILRWFGDSLSENSPFSLHHLVSLGENYGRKAGDWYGPTHAAHILRDALCEAKKYHPELQQLCMHVASDGIVFKQDVMDLCMNCNSEEKSNSDTLLSSDFETISLTELPNKSSGDIVKDNETADFVEMDPRFIEKFKSFEDPCLSYSEFGPPSYNSINPKWKSLLLWVSVRLGNDKINPFYIPCLKSLLAYENCIGFIGGRPKHALYFIGWQDDKIIHMDPHSCQPAVDVEKEDFNEKSFHSSTVRMMSFSEMDPSCSIGFYFKEMKDFQIFIEKFSEITAPLKRNLEYPVFALAEGKRIEVDGTSYLNEKCIYSSIKTDDNDVDEDDYILL